MFGVSSFPHLSTYLVDQVVHYSPYDPHGKVYPGPLVTDNGFWDTFRTVYPLLSLAYPDHLGVIIQGWLNAYKEGGEQIDRSTDEWMTDLMHHIITIITTTTTILISSSTTTSIMITIIGWLPSWASPGYRNCMVGTYADVVIADAIVKNITSFDWSTARDALLKDSFQQPPAYVGNAVGKLGLDEYSSQGFLSGTDSEAVSRTIDYGFADFAVAQVSRDDEEYG